MALEWLKMEAPGEAADARPVVPLHDHITGLYEAAHKDLLRYLLLLGVAQGEAQELCQETFLKLYVALRGGQQIENQRAWLFRVARNAGLNARARRNRIDSLDEKAASARAAFDVTPEQELLERERLERIHQAVQALSPQQRRCLHLRAEGFRYSDIAGILGIGSSSVGEFLRRAICRLREALDE